MSFLSYTHNFNNNLFMLFLRNPERYVPIVDFFGNMTENLSELLTWRSNRRYAA